jgi:GNAT superfamily N-acetyltransferase
MYNCWKFLLGLMLVCISWLVAEDSVKVRPARMEEVDVLYDLICELAQYEGKEIATLPLTKEHLQAFGFGEHPYFLVEIAEVHNQIVGYALYFYTFSAHKGYPVLYIDDLYVKEAFRKQGIGTQLLKQLANYAQQRQCCRMEWHVFDWNESAIRFYQRIGADLRKDLILVRLEENAMNRLIQE